jgi:hypothetical protein
MRIRDGRYNDSNPYVYRFSGATNDWAGNVGGDGLLNAISGWINLKRQWRRANNDQVIRE